MTTCLCSHRHPVSGGRVLPCAVRSCGCTALRTGLRVADGDTLHMLPLGDLIGHQPDDDCPCGPRQEPVRRDDGSVGWLVVHHSLDGREQGEDAATGEVA